MLKISQERIEELCLQIMADPAKIGGSINWFTQEIQEYFNVDLNSEETLDDHPRWRSKVYRTLQSLVKKKSAQRERVYGGTGFLRPGWYFVYGLYKDS